MGKSAVRFLFVILFISQVIIVYTQNQPLNDAENLGLRGPVKSLFIRRTYFTQQNGDRVQKGPLNVSRTDFNVDGNKTYERIFNSYESYTVFEYDVNGVLVKREEHQSGNIIAGMEKKSGAGNSYSLIMTLYDNDGSVKTRTVQTFDRDGRKIKELLYDDRDRIIQSWELKASTDGTAISYSPRWGGYESTLLDGRNRIVRMSKGVGSALQEWEFEYGDYANPEMAIYSEGTQPAPEIYSLDYDSEGNLSEVQIRRDGSEYSESTRHYSYTGRILAETARWYDFNGNIRFTWTYTYNSRGLLTAKEYFNTADSFSIKWEYRYDRKDRMTGEIRYDSMGRIFTEKDTGYDSDGNIISEHYSGRGRPAEYRILYEYNSAGRLVSTSRFNSAGILEQRELSRYNSCGDLEEIAAFNSDGSLINKTVYSYIYDEYRNWTEKKVLRTVNAEELYDITDETVSRNITYF